jgi:hypothetical protein
MGTGTEVDPFTLIQALASGSIKAGEVIEILNGSCTTIPYTTAIQGNSIYPIFIDRHAKERPIITGRFNVNNPYLYIKNLEFAKATYDPRDEADGACDEATWLDIYGGGYIKIINSIIHDFSYGIVSGQPEIEINGCIIYHTGWEEETYKAGHGIYIGNTDASKKITIKNCIIFDTWGFGIHCYGESVDVCNADINGNIVFNSGSLATYGGRRTNILLGCTGLALPRTGKVRNNCSYYPDLLSGTGIQVGLGAAGSADIEITNNYSAGGLYAAAIRAPVRPTVTGNTFIGGLQYFTAEDYADNIYAAAFPESGSKIVVYPLNYQLGRAHVAVYNWALANTVDVDLTSVTGLTVGDTVSVHNAQDYFTDIQTLTIAAGKIITVNMQAVNRTVATPVNWAAPATTFPRFGAFVVEKA